LKEREREKEMDKRKREKKVLKEKILKTTRE